MGRGARDAQRACGRVERASEVGSLGLEGCWRRLWGMLVPSLAISELCGWQWEGP